MGTLKFARLPREQKKHEEGFIASFARSELEKLCKSGFLNMGAFCVQRSPHQEEGNCCLALWNGDELLEWPITRGENESYQLFGEEFSSLSDLVAFYKENELPIAQKCFLGSPLSPKDFFQLQEWYLPHLNEHMTIQ